MNEGGWVIFRTQPRSELLAARAAKARGLEAYIPLVREQPAGRSSLLFPGYLFARISAGSDHLVRIRSVPGVAYSLPRGEAPTLLSDGVVDLIRKRLTDPPTTALRARWMEAVFDRRLSAAGRIHILFELAHRTLQLNNQKPGFDGDAAGLFHVWQG
jgi:transcription antitermination factor NusG